MVGEGRGAQKPEVAIQTRTAGVSLFLGLQRQLLDKKNCYFLW